MAKTMKTILAFWLGVLVIMSCNADAQSVPSLTITSPVTGTLVQPGQSIVVTVTGTNPPASGVEGLLTTGAIPFSGTQTSASTNQFSLSIPPSIDPGSYKITAVESSSFGVIESSTVTITVPPTYSYDSLQTEPGMLLFLNSGEDIPLGVLGIANGSSKVINNQFVSFQSSNSVIATVDGNGIVTPQSAGTTQILVTYGSLTATAEVVVAGSFLTAPQVTTSPTFSPDAGSFTAAQTVTLSDATTGATIYYTTDGTMPTTSSAVYSSPLSIVTTETIQAIAVASGYSQSPVASATYTINIPVAATPAFNPAAGTFTAAQTVTISDATAGAAVYYTTDGTTPTPSSTLYSGPITVSNTETVQAIATASGYSNSAVASAAYTINLPQDFMLRLSASSLSIAAGQSGTVTASVGPVNGFSQAVSFACSGLPSGAACSFSPATVTPNGTASATTTVTISTSATAGLLGENRPYELAGLVAGLSLLFAGRRFRKLGRIGALLLLMIGVGSAVSCGGGSSASKSTPTPTTSTVSISATSGSLTHTASLSLTVQ